MSIPNSLTSPVLCYAQSLQSCPALCDVTCQAPLPMGFSRQEFWSGLPFPSPGDLPDPGIKPAPPASPVLQADFTTEPPESQLDLAQKSQLWLVLTT